MEIISSTFYSGPNRHTLRPALEAIMNLGPYGHEPSTARAGFAPALVHVLPGLMEHHCSRGHRGGFAQRLQEGTYLGHVVEHVALECLYLCEERGVYGKTREMADGTVRVVFECETEPGGRVALKTAITIVTSLWNQEELAIEKLLEDVRRQLASFHLGPSTRAIVEAARRRDIPVARLNEDNLIRLGQGVHQHRMMATMSDRTSVVGVDMAQDKQLTARILEQAGILVPQSRLVHDAQEAQQALLDLGSPVVVKPVNGHQGQGVTMNVTTPEAVTRAVLAIHSSNGAPILIEQQIPGVAYRLLIVGQQMVAATERRCPFVDGDGQHSVKELVDILNSDPLRGPDHGFPMSPVIWDEETFRTLEQQGIPADKIIPRGKRVFLRRTANMSTGASARDVTAEVGADLSRDAVRAARALGLDIAGIDVVTPRLDQSLAMAGGAVVEVNAAPGLRMHLFPKEGSARPVADRLVEYLFGESTGRVPVAAVTGTNGKTTVTRMLGHIISRAGLRVGMATTDGISIGGEVIKTGDLTGPWSARLVLNDPTVEIAVLETARGGMARGGLGFDDVDVAVVTNIGCDHLGQDGIETLDDLVHLKSLIVDVVRPGGNAVLNADDPLVLGMRDRCRGQVILFSTHPTNEVVRNHVNAGGEAVYIKHGCLYYGHGRDETRLIGSRVLPASLGGVAAINVANAAAAAAAALGLGLTPRQVAEGLKSFPAGGAGLNRGRLEMMVDEDVRVLIDYGHNVPAITALGDICRRLKPRAIVTVLGLPGDRRDDDIRASARVVAKFSHRVVLREDEDRRGRAVGAVAELMYRAIVEERGENGAEVRIVLDEAEAVKEAILTAIPGSLVLVLHERYLLVHQAAEEALRTRMAVMKNQEVVERA